jgi:hypothetical protein
VPQVAELSGHIDLTAPDGSSASSDAVDEIPVHDDEAPRKVDIRSL